MKKYIIAAVLISVLTGSTNAQEIQTVLSQAVEYYSAGNCAEALPLFEEVVDSGVLAAQDNTTLLYSVNYYAGYCSRALSDRDRAVKYFSAALALAEKQNRREQLPVINTFLGETERESGNYSGSVPYYVRALGYLPDESADTATVLYFLAEAYRGDKQYDRFFSGCERVTAMAKNLKLIRLEFACMTGAGEAHYENGDYPQAMKIFNDALIASKSAQLPIETANNHMGLAIIYESVDKSDLARQNYEEALKLYVASASTANIPVITERLLALPHCPPAQAAKSAELYSQQAEELLGLGDDESTIYMQLLIGEYLRQAGNPTQSIVAYRNAIELAVNGDLAEEAATAAVGLSNVQYGAGDHSGAEETLLSAIRYQSAQNPPAFLAAVYARQGDFYARTNRPEEAKQSYRNAADSAMDIKEREKYSEMLKRLLPEP